MPNWTSLAAYGQELKGLEDDLTGPEVKKILRDMGTEALSVASRHAASDLGGDRAFSGWRRGAPIPLDTRLRSGSGTEPSIIMSPPKRSAGPWTVAEFGRNAAFGPRLTGPRLTKSGRVSRARRKRYNGRTAGKHTASNASREMAIKLPKIANKGIKAATRKRFDVT